MLEYFSKLKKPKAETVEKPAAGPGAEDLQDPKAKQSREDAQHDRDLFDHEAAQRASSSNPLHATPVLAPEDESFLENILNSDYGPAPPLPPRIVDWSPDTDTETDSVSAKSVGKEVKESKKKGDNKDNEEEGKEEKKAEKKPNRFSQFFSKKKASDGLKPETDVPPKEAEREKKDLGRVLDRLNLSAKNNKVVSLSNESSDLLRRFNQVFKDLVNGVPTAYDDLTALIEDRDGTIAKGFDKLPSSLKKLVTQLPDKITKSLAPEILLAAAEAQGLKTASGGGAKGAAKKLFMPQNIVELATKPGALVGMLRAIVEALKTRWPAFMGMNVLWSVALSLLLFMLWYCHKRGREVRLEREKSDGDIEDSDRVEELPDDPTLPAPHPETTTFAETPASPAATAAVSTDLPPPPIGEHAPTEGSRT